MALVPGRKSAQSIESLSFFATCSSSAFFDTTPSFCRIRNRWIVRLSWGWSEGLSRVWHSRLSGLGNVHLRGKVSFRIELEFRDGEPYHFDGIDRLPVELSVGWWLSVGRLSIEDNGVVGRSIFSKSKRPEVESVRPISGRFSATPLP